MQKSEKIFEELKKVFEHNIVKELNGDGTVDKYSINPWIAWNELEETIRKHMNDIDVNTTDLISREALLDDFRHTITEKSDTFDWLNMIARQPSVNKDDGWIPVEDQCLPENDGCYIVTVKCGDEYVTGYVCNDRGWQSRIGFNNGAVVAWKKGPEPYRKERSGNEVQDK